MLKIGLIGGQVGEYVSGTPYRKWMDDFPVKYYKKDTDEYLYEQALATSLEHHHKDVKVTYISTFNDKKIKKNDVNFLAGNNLLNAWEKSPEEYKRVYNIMKDKKNNIYPPLKEQFFLYNKGDYLKHFEKHGIPIAPTFLIKKNRDVDLILRKVKRQGWKSFVLKPYYAYANYGIKRFDMDDKKIVNKLQAYFPKNKKYPAFICQEVMIGFKTKWEIKSYWILGEMKYYVATKACDQVFDPDEIYGKCSDSVKKTVSSAIVDQVKKLGKKVVNAYPSPVINGKKTKPLYLRIDFGCCQGNTLDSSKYFLNEIEYAGCGLFTELKNVLHHWREGYYKKAIELTK
tara:strand:+ start:546 stop:1574 length:1029 start_codon:yes stop_codon:yes gene_type:complete